VYARANEDIHFFLLIMTDLGMVVVAVLLLLFWLWCEWDGCWGVKDRAEALVKEQEEALLAMIRTHASDGTRTHARAHPHAHTHTLSSDANILHATTNTTCANNQHVCVRVCTRTHKNRADSKNGNGETAHPSTLHPLACKK